MRGAFVSGGPSAKLFVRLYDRCVEPDMPELSRPRFFVSFSDQYVEFYVPEASRTSFRSAFLTDVRSVFVPEPCRPSSFPAFLADARSLLLRSSLGPGFCPLIGPIRGVLCFGTLSAKLFAGFSERCVEPYAPELSRPRVLPAYRTDAWSLMLRNLVGQDFCPLIWPMRELYAPEPFRRKVLSAYRTDVWSLVLRNISANFFCPLFGPKRGSL